MAELDPTGEPFRSATLGFGPRAWSETPNRSTARPAAPCAGSVARARNSRPPSNELRWRRPTSSSSRRTSCPERVAVGRAPVGRRGQGIGDRAGRPDAVNGLRAGRPVGRPARSDDLVVRAAGRTRAGRSRRRGTRTFTIGRTPGPPPRTGHPRRPVDLRRGRETGAQGDRVSRRPGARPSGEQLPRRLGDRPPGLRRARLQARQLHGAGGLLRRRLAALAGAGERAGRCCSSTARSAGPTVRSTTCRSRR